MNGWVKDNEVPTEKLIQIFNDKQKRSYKGKEKALVEDLEDVQHLGGSKRKRRPDDDREDADSDVN